MNRRIAAPGLIAVAMALFLAFPSCQDYGFEELPSSVIREKRVSVTVAASSKVDILFVIDNSNSMVGEQVAIAQSFDAFTAVLDEKFGEDQYNIAVITTGVYSEACFDCDPEHPSWYSCINETGEGGRFQDLIGHNNGDEQVPDFVFTQDTSCRVMKSENIGSCFYNTITESGVSLVGVRGCGYERGLAPMRSALSPNLRGSWNSNFLRDDAILAVVIISDEDDCGEVGDVAENLQQSGIMGEVCYYASKGIGPDGSFQDPEVGIPYQLTPIREYYDFLVELKGGRESMVKFAAIVGVDENNPDNPSATEITYDGIEVNSRVNTVCSTPECAARCDPGDGDVAYQRCLKNCRAFPGTRYIKLAELFGLGEDDNGFVATICQDDFSETLGELATFVACPRFFSLSEPILDPGLANILINGESVPRYSCSGSTKENIEVCAGLADTSCSAGACTETWSYAEPDLVAHPNAPGGTISFAEHYNPCSFITDGEIHFELIYVTP